MMRSGSQHRRRFALLALAALLMPACADRGRNTLLGYQFGPLHEARYKTIFVPIFENRAFQSGPLRGLEYTLTEEVQREIERSTHWKVVHDRRRADTELIGAVVFTPKNIINRNQLNEVREAEMILTVELTWRDVRTGEVLSRPGPGQGGPAAPDPAPQQPAPPVVVQARGRFLPEVGESTTTALQRASKALASQIVNLMEPGW